MCMYVHVYSKWPKLPLGCYQTILLSASCCCVDSEVEGALSGGGGAGGGGAASLASSRKKEKSKMKKKKPQQEKLKLCIIGLTQENEVVECQLETAKNHTVNFKFNCDEDEPQEIANNLVRNRRTVATSGV